MGRSMTVESSTMLVDGEGGLGVSESGDRCLEIIHCNLSLALVAEEVELGVHGVGGHGGDTDGITRVIPLAT